MANPEQQRTYEGDKYLNVPGVGPVHIPDNMTEGGALDVLVSRGIITAETAQEVGQRQEWLPPTQRQKSPYVSAQREFNEKAMIGIGREMSTVYNTARDKLVSSNITKLQPPRIDTDIPAPGTAGKIGEAFLPTAAHFSAPGRAIPQGAVGAAVRYAETGDALDAGATGLTTAAATGVANTLTRVGTGIPRIEANATLNRNHGQFIPTMPNTRTAVGRGVSRSLKGMGFTGKPMRLNQEIETRLFARTLGLGDDVAKVTPKHFARAESYVQNRYAAATAKLSDVPTRAQTGATGQSLKQMWDDVAGALPAKVRKEVGAIVSKDRITPEEFVKLDRILRDQIPKLRSGPTSDIVNLADDLQIIRDDLWNRGVKFGADKGLLADANQRFKLLSILKEQDAAVKTGEVDIGILASKFAKDKRTGFGDDYINQQLDNYAPDIQDLLSMTRRIASEPAAYGQAGQAQTLMYQSAAMGGGSALAGTAVGMGGASPLGVGVAAAGGLGVPWLAGRGVYGYAPNALGQAYGATASQPPIRDSAEARLRQWLGR